MEVILAVIRPKVSVNGLDYRAKHFDILLLSDHKNVDSHGKPTKYFPAFTVETEDEILTNLYAMTGGDHGGIKGERALIVPWGNTHSYRDSLSRLTLYCIPVSSRDKLNSNFVDKSPNNPGFYSLDNLVHSLNSGLMNFPPPTRTIVTHLENWLKEKHSKPGVLDIVFRTRTDFRISLNVSNPVFLPVGLRLSDSTGSLQKDIPNEMRVAVNEAFAKMVEIEKCTKVVINPLFGTGLTAKPRMRSSWSWPTPTTDYFDSNTSSRKGSLNSSMDPELYTVQERELYPIHFYASKGDVPKVQDLISRYPVTQRDSYGWTPIHFAAWHGHKDVVQILLHAGCSPNEVNFEDKTPLHLAAIKGNPSVVDALLNHPEVDMNLLDKKGRTALEMCEQKLGWEHIQVAKRLDQAARQPRQIQVRVMDGTSKSLGLVDGFNTTVHQLNLQMLHEYNMPETPYADIFTIWICSQSLELQLKPEHKPLEHMNIWKRRIVGVLFDADPKKEEPHLKWRRNAKISLIVEKEVKHPEAINLLFHEACHYYINAKYPCKDQDVEIFASILLYMKHGNETQAAKQFLTKNLQLMVPAPMLKHRSNWANRILHQYKEFSNEARLRSELVLKDLFLAKCRNLTVYGSAFFTGNLQMGNSRQTTKCFIGVNDVGLHIINSATRIMLHSYKYSEINWRLPPIYGLLELTVVKGEARDRHTTKNSLLKLQTKQAGMINHLMGKLSQITYGIVTSRTLNAS